MNASFLTVATDRLKLRWAKVRARSRYTRLAFVPKVYCFLTRIEVSTLPCRSFLPPVVRRQPVVAPSGSLWSELPVTQYIGDGGSHRAFVKSGRTLDVPSSGVPTWFTQFDWVVGTYWGFTKRINNPRSVWVHGKNFSHFMQWLEEESSLGKVRICPDSILVVGGKDHQPSQYDARAVERSKKMFPRVFFEANDGLDSAISTYPTAINDANLRGHDAVIRRLLSDPPPKKTLLFASWGLKWSSLNKRLSDRAKALSFLETCPFADIEVVPTEKYLKKMASSHYMLYPRGQGIQSPKGFEAWLFKTIPVVTSHPVFLDLKDRGVPLLIVESWSEVTEDLLHHCLPQLQEQVDAFHHLTLDAKKWWDFCFAATQ